LPCGEFNVQRSGFEVQNRDLLNRQIDTSLHRGFMIQRFNELKIPFAQTVFVVMLQRQRTASRPLANSSLLRYYFSSWP
jgi:hypothetical protein